MFERTENENYINHDSYNGIKVCERWKKFEHFKDDMYESWLIHNGLHGGRNTTVDRLDVYGDYTKENCTWATQAEQSLNKKNTRRVTFNGKEIALQTLCKQLAKNYERTYHRMKRGYSLDRALNATPWQR